MEVNNPLELVLKIFDRSFSSAEDSEELRELLLSYDGKERERVQLAVLKLSDKDPEKLRHNVKAAMVDYRDVLAWAEYPEQLDTGATQYNTDAEEYQAIIDRDRKQYIEWLSQETSG